MEEGMENITTPIVTGALLALFTAIQAWINKGRFDRLENEIAALRSDLLHVALAGSRRRDDG
jgi:hypothetical protein